MAGQDYKNYILSLMFFKRLCDQWENEADDAIAELERQQGRTFTEKQKAKAGEMERAKNLACVNELRCAIRCQFQAQWSHRQRAMFCGTKDGIPKAC